MHHLFANSHIASASDSSIGWDVIDISSATNDAHKDHSLRSQPTHTTSVPLSGTGLSDQVVSASAGSAHFVTHTSQVTLLLNGQESGISTPVCRAGCSLEGVLVINRPDGLLAFEVKVEGVIKLKETAGGGNVDSVILCKTLYSWDSQHYASIPSKVAFKFTFPTHYYDPVLEMRFLLPPTYHESSNAIPGFNIDVAYAIVINMTRNREMSGLWRRNTRLNVPFLFKQMTCPPWMGPFAKSSIATPSHPKTLFVFSEQPRGSGHTGIETHLFLPKSQFCCIKDPIPFYVILFADEASLEPFESYRPRHSFHRPSTPSIRSSRSSLSQRLVQRTHDAAPVRIYLQRTTCVNALNAYPTDPRMTPERAYTSKSKILAEGIVRTAARGTNSITWAGSIEVPPSVTTVGFSVAGLNVTDSIVLSITPPERAKLRYMMFHKAVEVHLTTERCR